MVNNMKLSQTMQEVEKMLEDAKREALSTIEASEKQNPKINKIGKCIFSIKLSNLSEDLVLSPHYYDFKWQFDLIIKNLKRKSIESFVPFLKLVVEKGKCNGERLHPDVLKILSDLI